MTNESGARGRRRAGTQGKSACGTAAVVLAALLCAACLPDEGAGPPLVPGGMTAPVKSVLDSAAAAFEGGDTFRARELYVAVLAEDSTLAAAWLGLHLADRALDPGAADTALARARALIEPPPRPRGRGQRNPGT